MKSRIHVNQHNIRKNQQNLKAGGLFEALPVLSVKTYKGNTTCDRVKINGPAEVVYSPDKPLSCGARVWIETDAPVEIL